MQEFRFSSRPRLNRPCPVHLSSVLPTTQSRQKCSTTIFHPFNFARCRRCRRTANQSGFMPDGICGKSAAPYVLIPRPLFNHNKVLGASDSPRWGVSQSGFGHGRAIDTSSRTDPQRGRCEYEVESLLWQSSLLPSNLGNSAVGGLPQKAA